MTKTNGVYMHYSNVSIMCIHIKSYHPVHYYLRIQPTRTRRLTNVGLMLVHRLRRWPNIKPALVKRLVSAVYYLVRRAETLK